RGVGAMLCGFGSRPVISDKMRHRSLDGSEAIEKPKRKQRKPKRAGPGWRPARSKHGGGQPAFVPPPIERAFVRAMAGLRMNATEMCKVLGYGRNSVDGASGKPLNRHTLFKHFKNEMAAGRALLKAQVAGRFYEALSRGDPWAIQVGLRNHFGFD